MKHIDKRFTLPFMAVALFIFNYTVLKAQITTQTFSYTGSVQIFTVPSLCVNQLTIETWGAEGGGQALSSNFSSGQGGKGGYAKGTLTVVPGSTLYIYVGGHGSSSSSGLAAGGFNGGGSGYASSSGEPGNGGGGASDVRVNGQAFSNRVIVAGGGGGGGEDSGDQYGHGGGLTGVGYTFYDATQTAPGPGGSLGMGGSTGFGDGGGGGGGYYGGGTNSSSSIGSDTQGGGGGSGYIGGVSNGVLIAGNTSMPNPLGGNMFGRSGHGLIRISYEDNSGILVSSSPSLICSGSSATLTASGVSTYTWSDNSNGTSFVVSPTVATAYTVSGTNSVGCVSQAVININVNSAIPSLSLSSSATSGSVCANQTVALTAAGANSYTWSSGAANGSVFTPSATSIYSVSGENGCGISTETIQVHINPSPSLSVNSGSICSGSSFTISPSGANTYSYSSGSNVVTLFSAGQYNYIVTGYSSAGCTSTILSTVNVFARPTIFVNSGSICSGNSFTISPTSGIITSYTVSGGSNVVSPTVSTSYSVTGSNAAGCVSTNTAISNVIVNSNPTITVNSGTVCSGKSFVLVASGATSYTYSSGSSVVFPTSTTTYSVIGRNASTGCAATNTAIATVSVYTTPTISVSGGSICSGSSFTLNPTGAAAYSISGGNFVVTPTTTSNYTVTGTSTAGCVSANTVIAQVTVAPRPVIIANGGAICSGQTFFFNPSGADYYTYSSGFAAVSPNTTTTYSITGGFLGGCQALNPAVVTVTVNNLPNVVISGPAGVCIGSSATLSASGASSYTWSTGFLGLSIAISPTTATTYTVFAKDAFGCQNKAVKSVNVYGLPSVSITGNTVICSGTPVSFLGGGTAITYSWSNGFVGNVLTVAPVTSTFYTVTGFDANNCSSTASIAVSVNPAPQITANAINTLICEGKQAVLFGGGAVTYTWSGGVNNNTIFYPSTTATYTLSGTAANGCKNTATVSIVVNPLPAVTVSSTSQPLCPGQTATISAFGANIYSWSTGNITSKIVVTPSVTSTYTVTGTDANGCANSVVFQQILDECLGLNSLTQANSILIYPNPSKDFFRVKLVTLNPGMKYTVCNSLGQVIYTQSIHANECMIPSAEFANGIYFISIYENDVLVTQEKLVKTN